MEDSSISEKLVNISNNSSFSTRTPQLSSALQPKFYENKQKLSIFAVFSVLLFILSGVGLYFAVTWKMEFQTVLIFAVVILLNFSAFCVFSSVFWCVRMKKNEKKEVIVVYETYV
ncbi:Hypothetical_protein [Hexamita inflata]|uniref:Hypothetical_protein n=1 Tax=Hexamita inflata TaxID=28002 RepID=A0AA86NNW3_9EUKA|nr:Hypothetical protein HINF_LOCUS10689 [Hexamita inflata]